MAESNKRVVFVTGASSGIGNSCATFLAKKGFVVYGTSRNPRAYAKKADEFFELLTMDVCNDASVKGAVEAVLSREGRIDVLMCNAGMGIAGSIEEAPVADVAMQMDVNFMGAVRTIQAVLPGMRKRGSGTILVTSSIGGRMGLPFTGFYCASKFALEGLVEALRLEIRQFGVQACLLEPGDFRSGFTASRITQKFAEDSPYAANVDRALAVVVHDEMNGANPVEIARLVLRLLSKRRLRVRYTVGSFFQTAAVAVRPFLSDTLAEKLLALYYRLGAAKKK